MSDLSRFSELHLKHYHPVGTTPPQKQCKYPKDHTAHNFEHHKTGLICHCQGKGQHGNNADSTQGNHEPAADADKPVLGVDEESQT